MMEFETSLSGISDDFKKLLRTSDFTDVSEIREKILSSIKKEGELRTFTDHMLRDFLPELVSNSDNEILERYLHYVIQACRSDLCSPSLPAVIMGDMFDMLTLNRCEILFEFVEKNVHIWKETIFFAACKNNILRMCNDLLRRLSRSQNTIFCGRILLFLAKFFPFSERSGLNIVSEFNLENVTEFTNDCDIDTSKKESSTQDTKETKMKLDYTIYSKFWSLQDYFRYPNLCYTKPKWNLFCAYADSILSIFAHYKLDSISENSDGTAMEIDENRHYFAKYLTNQKLIELQLSDINFRRYVLIQFLILFQYLNAPVKFKLDTYELKSEQEQWVKEAESKVYKLLLEIPTDGEQFVKIIRYLLKRENHWNNWKNEGCPEIKKPTVFEDSEMETADFGVTDKLGKSIGEVFKQIKPNNQYYMVNRQLTKLWNKCPVNLDACKSQDRNFLPSLENYFEDVPVEANPESCIDTQYKKVCNSEFTWRGLRLLARKCPYFFMQNNTPIHKTDDYIENMVGKFLKEKPISTATAAPVVVKPINDNQEDFIEQAEEEDEEETVEEPEEGEAITPEEPVDATPEVKRELITQQQLDKVSEIITSNWQKVAVKIGYQPDEIEFFLTEKPTDEQRARYLLQVWSEDCEDPSPENLAYILEGLDMNEAAKLLKSK